ncbi:hypothetical protein V2J09_022966 [Rumex salicifolius]
MIKSRHFSSLSSTSSNFDVTLQRSILHAIYARVMTSTLHSESRHSYSWWWDSHISPKNSKWLQDNLTDIDGKVKSMIKIINEDADSFARRADMYYKKRPELMKLVEEFYRAYRALAERYDHATGELRIAHRTMIEAFPNQDCFLPGDDPDDLKKDSDAGLNKNGLKQLNEIFQTGEAVLRELKTAEERLRKGNLQEEKEKDSSSKQGSMLLSDKNRNLDLRTMILNQSEQSGKVEAEMRRLKQVLAQMEAERDATLSQYQQSLEKLTILETELNSAQADAKELDKHASEAQIEVKELKESLKKMEAERDSSLFQFNEGSKRLASLEAMANKAVQAETESRKFKQELSRVETDKEGALAQYHESLEKISELEKKLWLADESAKMCREQNERAECEIKALKEDLSRLYKEKEDAYLQYQQCLNTISKLQNELMDVKEEVERLKGEVLLGSAQLKCAEDQCALLEEMNQSLNLEANVLVQEIAAKDEQLSEKQTELEKLMNGLQNEQSSFIQVEAMLHSLQSMHLQSQEEQRSLALDLRNGLQMLRDLELCKQDLELEIQGLREQNQGLHDMKLASSVSESGMQDEIKSLQEIKEKLEAEVKRQSDQNVVLQKQFDRLKEEIEDLYKKYSDLVLQVESSGINPKCLQSSIKDLQEENSRLKKISNEGKTENEGLLRRLEDMEGIVQKSSMLGSSFVDLKVELESSKEKMKALQDSCNALSGEKTIVMAEKTALLSQLKIITDSMQKLLENNVTLDKSLQGVNIELEGLRVKSKGLEDFCQYLKEEKSGLVTERSGLVFRLECVEKNLEELAKRFTELKDKYAGVEKERDLTRDQVAELRISLSAEKQERQFLVLSNETRLSGLEENIRHLQEENKCRKNDFEEQLEKAVNAQVEIFILQKFMKDMEEKHFSLLAECHKHAEAAKYSEKIISELESENMMQHLETEYLLDRVDNLRRGISQVLKALEIDHVSDGDPEVFLPRVRGKIKDIGRSLSDRKDENQQLLIQNDVLSAVIMQLSSDGKELTTRKEAVDHEFFLLNQQHVMLENEKHELLERSQELDILVVEKERGKDTLKVQLEALNLKQETLEKEFVILKQEHSNVLKENRFLQDKLLVTEEEKLMLDEENSGIIQQALSFANQSVVFKSSLVQTALELKRVSNEMCRLREAYADLANEARSLEEKMAIKETENTQLREIIKQLEEKNQELNVCTDWLFQKCSVEREQYNRKEVELHKAEQRLMYTEDMNEELNTTIEGLQVRYEDLDVTRGTLEQQVVELSECREHLEKEMVLLREANGSLESEVIVLSEEIEACRLREVSSVREAVLESKVHEISGLFEDLNTRRSTEIEMMKDKISLLESERADLKCKMAAYIPAIASIKDNVSSLEQTPVLCTKLHCTSTQKQQIAESKVSDMSDGSLANAKEQTSQQADEGLSELQELQSRLKAIESILAVEEVSMEQCVNASNKLKPTINETGKLKSSTNSPRTPDLRIRTHMKDIPLDHNADILSSSSGRRRSGRLSNEILALREASEKDSTFIKTRSRTSPPRSDDNMHIELDIADLFDSNPGEIEKELGVDNLEVSKTVSKQGKQSMAIIEKLASDAQKLASLQTSVQELRRRIETNKKSKTSKVEHKRLNVQLQDVENSVLQLVDMNTRLAMTMKESSLSSCSVDPTEAVEVEQALSGNVWTQARTDSEKIECLQLEMQKIEYILLTIDDDKVNTNKIVKSRFSRVHTGIILREFVYNRGRRSRKNKNSRFCCFRPSLHREV